MRQKIAVIAVAAALTGGCYHLKSSSSTTTKNAAYGYEDPVINGSFIVEPRNFKPFKIVVATNMATPHLEGSFSATGANNDIEVLLLEESQFLNWQSRHAFRSAYQSGRVTADKLNISLPAEAATYFMVFSNQFSMFSNKGVTADVKLCYNRQR